MGYDWKNLAHTNDVEIQMISQNDGVTFLKKLDGVKLEGSYISMGYYTDTRQQAVINTVNSNYIRNSFIKIIHKVPEWNYEKALGVFAVTNDNGVLRPNHYTSPLQCASMLYLESLDDAATPKVINKNATISNVLSSIASQSRRRYSIASNINNYKFSSTYILDAGESTLDRLFTLSNASNNRIDVNGDGVITIFPYVLPNNKTPVFRFDLADEHGLIIKEISRSNNYLELPTRVVVYHSYSDSAGNEKYISGYADAVGQLSEGYKGYRIVDFIEEPELTPRTKARADALAKSYLAANTKELIEWEFSCPYIPLWEGDVVSLNINDGPPQYRGVRKCLVKSVRINLDTFIMDLTLKETSSPDYDE